MKKQTKKRALITVIGKDKVGTVAEVSSFLSKNKINIEEISQNIMSNGIFAMLMSVDLSGQNLNVSDLSDKMRKLGKKIKHEIYVYDEDIISAMHRI